MQENQITSTIGAPVSGPNRTERSYLIPAPHPATPGRYRSCQLGDVEECAPAAIRLRRMRPTFSFWVAPVGRKTDGFPRFLQQRLVNEVMDTRPKGWSLWMRIIQLEYGATNLPIFNPRNSEPGWPAHTITPPPPKFLSERLYGGPQRTFGEIHLKAARSARTESYWEPFCHVVRTHHCHSQLSGPWNMQSAWSSASKSS